MPSWLQRTLASVEIHVEQAQDLRRASLEDRFREQLTATRELIDSHRLQEASAELRALENKPYFRSDLSPSFQRLHQETQLVLRIALLKERTVGNQKRPELEEITQDLAEIEREAFKLNMDDIAHTASSVRGQVYIDESRIGIAPRNSMLTRLNVLTFTVLMALSVATAMPLLQNRIESSPFENWAYTLHPEMLGAAITFILLTVIFETGRQKREIRQQQYTCYQEMMNAANSAERQKLLDEMVREDLLCGAYLVGLDWQGLDLRKKRANLRRAILRDGVNIDQAFFDETTILPNGKRFRQEITNNANFDKFIYIEQSYGRFKRWRNRLARIMPNFYELRPR